MSILTTIKNFLGIGLGLQSISAQSEVRVRPEQWAKPVLGSDLENLYQISADIYRSEQPDDDDFTELAKFGIRSVLNLREYHDDQDETEHLELTLHQLTWQTSKVSQADLLAALRVLMTAEKPVLVHCWHGADRTGATIATYRVVIENWSKEEAIDEFVNGGFGFHQSIYGNLTQLINELDVPFLRQELGLVPSQLSNVP